ncbi:hypothetical protein HX096_12820 [Empedobacter falsenii]|uniref:hypothetical protein n=1 Tax=Empedobacter falsenii TaxID=343874 RepID=UPI0025754D39|nr:hypothetical protein [Empedobacter falsenii]MDM1548736.1 hypothetical protein [Empedobacter falsenii]
MEYYSVNEKKLLKDEQTVICRCPEWNDEGYQIAVYSKSDDEFWYSGQPNNMFNDLVIAFCPIDINGKLIPCQSQYQN